MGWTAVAVDDVMGVAEECVAEEYAAVVGSFVVAVECVVLVVAAAAAAAAAVVVVVGGGVGVVGVADGVAPEGYHSSYKQILNVSWTQLSRFNFGRFVE